MKPAVSESLSFLDFLRYISHHNSINAITMQGIRKPYPGKALRVEWMDGWMGVGDDDP